jgi:hypothetical protein
MFRLRGNTEFCGATWPRTWVAPFGMTDAASRHTTTGQARPTADITVHSGLAGNQFHLGNCTVREGSRTGSL